jgi:hypothetical protein
MKSQSTALVPITLALAGAYVAAASLPISLHPRTSATQEKGKDKTAAASFNATRFRSPEPEDRESLVFPSTEETVLTIDDILIQPLSLYIRIT